MKKIGALIIMLVAMFMLCGTALSEQSELDDLREEYMRVDLDALIAYRDFINEIISERGGEVSSSYPDSEILEGEDFSAGVYEVGKNIKAGTYILNFYNMDAGAILNVYESKEEYNEGEPRERCVATESTASYTVTLENGNVMTIMMIGGNGKIKIDIPDAPWMP